MTVACWQQKVRLMRSFSSNSSSVGHRLKLRSLAGVEAVQPLGKVVQLIHIDREHFHSLEDGVEAVDLFPPCSPP